MPIRNIITAVLLVVAFLAGAIFQKMITPAQQAAGGGAPDPGSAAATPPAAGTTISGAPPGVQPGLAWDLPSRWADAGPREMRFATYTVPPAHGTEEAGECAVFYFGPTQGGGVDDNINRWIGQFEHPSQPQRSTKTINGFEVRRVEVKGDYLAPSGPMMQSSGKKSGYMLLGAIVQGPNGKVFFKLTGPEKVIKAAAREFDGLLASLRAS